MNRRSLAYPIALLILLLTPVPLLAQSITPADDGTGTQVTREGDRYTITGGTRTQENLFHSFERLGLSSDEIATFLSQPGIENILGRVTGGQASILDGLLQVQDGANLYLMNPAGIVFGPNAQLDLSGSFLATTATGIGFGDYWFNAVGDNTYAALVGNPDSFAFSLANGGSIANFANLTVAFGESITLMGSTVTNTGTLTAPDGTITLAAVPGENRVRLSQAGSLLSLELEAANGVWDAALNPPNMTPLSLPQLLTGGDVASASQMTVNPDGTVRIGGANVPVQDGTTLVTGALNAEGTDGEITVLGDRIALLNADLNVSGANGGTIRIGGDYQGQGTVFNASHTYVSEDSTLSADALGNGDGGRAIVWADDTTQFLGTVTARGGAIAGNGGFVEVSGAQNLLFNGQADLIALNGQIGTLLLDPTDITIVNGTTGGNDTEIVDGQVFVTDTPTASFTLSEATLEALSGNTNVRLEASNNITLNSLTDGALTFATGTGSITFTADADSSGVGDFTMDTGNSIVASGRNITISATSITVGTINTSSTVGGNSGSINLNATGGDITAQGLNTTSISSSGNAGNGGAITLSALGGTVTATNLLSYSEGLGATGNGGAISVSAGRNASLTDLFSYSSATTRTSGNGGEIRVSAVTGNASLGSLRSYSLGAGNTGDGGDITLSADGTLTVTDSNAHTSTTSGTAGDGGAIALEAGDTITTNLLDSSSAAVSGIAGNGGAIDLDAGGDISAGDLNSFSQTSSGTTGDGGSITLTADGDITTGSLSSDSDSSSATSGNGGAITLTSTVTDGDIEVDFIDADGSDGGVGGDIDITAGQFFRATGSTLNSDGVTSSISSTGGDGGGAITIRHGGNGTTPFVLGSPVSDNGTVAAITNGDDAFTAGESIVGSETRGDIQILTDASDGSDDGGDGGSDDGGDGGSDGSGEVDDGGESEILSQLTCQVDCNELTDNTVTLEAENTVELSDDISATQDTLLSLAEQTGIPPALIYVGFVADDITLPNSFAQREAIASQQITHYLGQPNPTQTPLLTVQPQPSDELELLLVLPNGDVVRRRVEGVTRAMVLQQRQEFITAITAPTRLRSNRYRVPSQQLYEWLIAPIEADLEAQHIGNLSFILDAGLRSLPLAALYDGQHFLIERYSIGLMPSVSLTDTQYHDLRDVPILAMGASQFDRLQALPAVPTEVATITATVPNSISYLNQDFTETNLLKSREERPYAIVHLATHAEFLPGEVENSFIQFGDRRLNLNQLRELHLNNPPVELLVLSACKTALGDDQAELGFGGLAVQAGVRSVLASLWYVSDTGTLTFMTEFYRQLQEAPIRTEALRQAQLAMLQGDVQLQEDHIITSQGTSIPIPTELIDNTIDLTHPYFWAAFTMIGSPW